jgi:DNA-binding transcriptional ArsR family regulator
MTKTWQTKKKILKLVSKGAKTPGEISEHLGLAPSTVSEHLDELERMGAVKEVENEFIRKWKYYKANPDFDVQTISSLKKVSNIPQILGALAVALGLVAFFVFVIPNVGTLGKSSSVVFSLTDPPSVPNGTQALNITYSSLQTHYVGSGNTNSSAWVPGSGSGSLDLMSLINSSQIIGTGSVPENSTINMVRFDIASAYIVINGTKYNVTVPSGELTVPVTGGGRITSNSSVLIDLSPVVTTIYTNNSTDFVLVPSVRAVFVGSTNVTGHVGEMHTLTRMEHERLNATAPVIGITDASFKVVNNSTVQLSVTVKNDGNESVPLVHVILFGLPSVFVSPDANSRVGAEIDAKPMLGNVATGTSAGIGGGKNNVTVGISEREKTGIGYNSEFPDVINGVHVMVFGNGTVNATTHMPILSAGDQSKLESLVTVGAAVRSFRVLNFLVTANGTLALPFLGVRCSCRNATGPCPEAGQISVMCIVEGEVNGSSVGYTLHPGASATLTFSGRIDYANNHLQITPINGSNWMLVVQGDNGARAVTNLTVTSG